MKRPCIALCLFLGAMAASLLAVEMPYGQANVAIAIPPVRPTAARASLLLSDPDFACYFATEVPAPRPAETARLDERSDDHASSTADTTSGEPATSGVQTRQMPLAAEAVIGAAEHATSPPAGSVPGGSLATCGSAATVAIASAAASEVLAARLSAPADATASAPGPSPPAASIANFEDHWLPSSMWSAEWQADAGAAADDWADTGAEADDDIGSPVGNARPNDVSADETAAATSGAGDARRATAGDTTGESQPGAYSLVVAEERTASVLGGERAVGSLTVLSNPVVMGLLEYLADQFYLAPVPVESDSIANAHTSRPIGKPLDEPAGDEVAQTAAATTEVQTAAGFGAARVLNGAAIEGADEKQDALAEEEMAECFPTDFYYGTLPYVAAEGAGSQAAKVADAEPAADARQQQLAGSSTAGAADRMEPTGLYADDVQMFEVEAPYPWDELSGLFGCNEDGGRCALLDGTPLVESIAPLVDDARHSSGIDVALELNAENDGLPSATHADESESKNRADSDLALAARNRRMEQQRAAVEAAVRPLAQAASDVLRDLAEGLNGLAGLFEQMATASGAEAPGPRTAASGNLRDQDR